MVTSVGNVCIDTKDDPVHRTFPVQRAYDAPQALERVTTRLQSKQF